MTWQRITNGAEVQYVASLDGIGPEWTAVAIIEDRAPVGLEQVDDEGNIFVPVAVQRDALKAQVEAVRTAKETGTASTPVGTVTIDEPSKAKILGALSMCRLAEEASQTFALNFTLADGSRVALTSTTVRQLAGAVGQYVAALYDHAHSLFDALDAATTGTDLDAIDIETGWPS